MGLPKSIIKKYGVSKKAWSVFRAQRSSNTRRAVTAKTTTKKHGGAFMARRKHGFKKKHSSKSSGGISLTGLVLPSMVYGAVREKASNALAPITSKVPLGNVADELVLGTIAYFAAKKTSGMVRDVARAALTVEAARLGEALVNGQVGLGGASGSQNY